MKAITSLCLFSLFFLSQSFAQSVDFSLLHGIKPRNIGPAGMSGRVTAIDVELANPDHIYIGAAAGGVWESHNGGLTWAPLFEGEKTASIGDLTLYQANPKLIYVGTGEGNPRNSHNSGWGMYKSLDGGQTWQHLGLEQTRQIHRVLVHPSNPDLVWAGATGSAWADSEHRGIYKSADGGQSWRKVLYVDPRTGCADLVMDPANPNHLLAAMWSHRRRPDFFTSGGPGSAIYSSWDGGDTWQRLGQEAGLPDGELGRIGLAFAPSQPSRVYAYVESKENAIYRSDDGGRKWTRQSQPKDEHIGGRPFYYAELHVDTRNENRVYSLATEVTVSEDGGKTWATFAAGDYLHTDHHAWWSHPENPNFLLLGSDGGLHISRDRGQKWGFADHLPLAQFYHVRVDNQVPYQVYGGLQDNGSWGGPSQVWFKGGIRNFYWQRLSVGDGFDVVPDPQNPDYGYAMGQAGNLVRYHRPSGQLTRIKPIDPEDEYLRFNWNTGIALDPHDQQTVYYGAQYLLQSRDYGRSWTRISPDLTTNDPAKQHFLETGGLTYDVTGAEFHTSIISIAPSALERGLIWVGTDDGKVQLTRDGGQNWTDVGLNISQVPAHTWVPHIKASAHQAGEAFVVFDDHRRNNWTPYVFRTRDFGLSWERIVDEQDVEGFVYCLEQDPVQPELLFCGTDVGLFVSLDAGSSWHRWTAGYPTVPTRDLVIHPRDHDLIIGTFGRSFWILDDIRPLREIARRGWATVMGNRLEAFPCPPAILAIQGESLGYRKGKVGDHLYEGENRPYGALISYSLRLDSVVDKAESLPLAQQVKLEILNNNREVLRTLYQPPKNGLNRIAWDLSRDAVRMPNQARPEKEEGPKSGFAVGPGSYVVRISYGEDRSQTSVDVRPDMRLEKPLSAEALSAKEMAILRYLDWVRQATEKGDQIRSLEKSLAYLETGLKSAPDAQLSEAIAAFRTRLSGLKEAFWGKEAQGIYRDPSTVVAALQQTGYLLDHPLSPLTANQRVQMEVLEARCARFFKSFSVFWNSEVKALRKQVDKAGWSLWGRE